MYIANSEAYSYPKEILEYLPNNIRQFFYGINLSDAYEIHMGVNMPICVYFTDGRYFISRKGRLIKNQNDALKTTNEDILKTLELITGASVYSVKNEIADGYITIAGGHRIGICGSAVIRGGRVSYIKDIAALNFRLAEEVIGASDKIINYITDGNRVRNTLFISPPGAGKTTILRDTARKLSDMEFRVGIVDERREIAAVKNGRSAFDLGLSCDVMSGIDKARGMMLMLRSMSPEVIITDELGGGEDIEAVKKMLKCGVSVIASVHGDAEKFDRENELYKCFDVLITLSKRNGAGTVERIVKQC